MDHHHLIVHALIRRPIVKPDEAVEWVTALAHQLGMTLMAPPQAAYSDVSGNRGVTAVALITTSHISIHLWDETQPAELQLDVYSCKAYRKEIVFDAIKERFLPINIRYKFIDRLRNLTLYNEANA